MTARSGRENSLRGRTVTTMNDDTISRAAVLDKIHKYMEERDYTIGTLYDNICEMPSAHPTLYGYNIEHLELIARVLQKEDLPPERVVEALKDIGRIVAIVKDEFEETLRKAVEQCMI